MTLNQRVTEIAKAARNTIVHALKLIAIMTVLLIIVKNPTWDSFFSIILIFQIGRILWVILSIQTKINNARRKDHEDMMNDFKRQWSHFGRQQGNSYQKQEYNYKRRPRISREVEISNSSKILGINIVQDDEIVIKKKYRSLAMKWHPDKFANDTKENQDIANRNFQKISGAYDVVKKYKNIN